MWYGNTKILLESAVRQLQLGEARAEDEWEAQTQVVATCLAEMAEISGTAKKSDSRYVHRPAADKLNRAVPHVRAMLDAMLARDAATALRHGTEAIRRL